MITMGVIALALITTFGKRRNSVGSAELKAIDERLARMEQAIDAMAVETERISEGQRFAAKLLSERRASNAAELNDAGLGTRDSPGMRQVRGLHFLAEARDQAGQHATDVVDDLLRQLQKSSFGEVADAPRRLRGACRAPRASRARSRGSARYSFLWLRAFPSAIFAGTDTDARRI